MPLRVQLLEEGDECGAVDAIEVSGRLVREKDRRLADQCAGHGRALHLSARQLVRAVLGTRAHPQALEHRASSAAALRRRHAGEGKRQGDVVNDAEAGKQVERLKDHADALAPVASERLLVQLR